MDLYEPTMPTYLLANGYGSFDPETAAYTITEIFTPRPWVNVLSNDRYGLVVSQAGGGFAWYENCQLYRISRWDQDLVRDEMGRFVYVQDLDEPDDLWSTTYQPTRKRGTNDTVTHGLGFTRFDRDFRQLSISQTMFVPLDADCEMWLIEVRNLSDRPRRLRLASYQELQLGDNGEWHREFHRLFMESKAVGDRLVAWKHPNLPEHERSALETPVKVAFSWQGADSIQWFTDKLSWLGRCGSLDRPAALFDLPYVPETPRWDDPVAVGIVDLALKPGETRTLLHIVAASRNEKEALRIADTSINDARESYEATTAAWQARCRQNPVDSGEAAIDLMANAWFPYQAIAGRIFARCAYFQQGGAYGFRDQLQDSLLFLDLGEPESTLLQLKKHAGAMFADGGVRHWWHPGTKIGPESHHCDTCLWLSFGTLAYLDSTGDRAALDVVLPYYPGKEGVSPLGEAGNGEGTLLDHCLRGVERALRLRSERGLPLMGAGDWNDGLSHAGLDGKGESVWLGMFLFGILKRIAPVLAELGHQDLADRYDREAEALREAVNLYGWDGEWYIEGTRDDGRTLGGHDEPAGSLFLNPQTWAVLSGIAPPERAQSAMAAVKRRLVQPYGALLLRPAFSAVDPYVGYITRYAPGLRENGGVYSHASVWAILAFAQIGDSGTAKAIFRGMLPPLRSQEDADNYATEPYVMPGNVDGPDSPYEGRAGWTWYTGSAAWMARVARQLDFLANR